MSVYLSICLFVCLYLSLSLSLSVCLSVCFEARGVWPGLVVCVVPNDWHKGTPGDAWLLDYESLVVYLREVLLEGFPVDQKVGLYAVKPFVTPFEQFGEDALYILVLLDPREGERAILIVEDHWQSDHFQLWPIGVGELTDTWQVIEEAHRTIDCEDYETTCILEYDMQELPRMVQWRTLPGMKLHLTISRDGDECELPLAVDDDEVEMMQATQHEPVDERQRAHMQRLGVDPVYFQVTRYLDARLLQIPQGGIAQIWLLPGVGITSHDASVMLDLRVEIPSWGNWVRESWRDEPPEGRFLMIRGPLPAIRASKIDFHLIGASSSDLANGLRTLLVDLRFNSVLRRGAVRCPLLATVAEIVKHFTGRQFPIDSPLLESFQLHWRSGGDVHVYHAFQIPAAPDGAFVHVVMRSTRVSQVLAQPVSDTCATALA